MDIRALNAAQKYAAARPATEPVPGTGTGLGQALGEVAKNFAETFREGEETAKAAMIGQADPHSLVQALSQTELAVEAAVTVRDKVVEAYQEILRMPV
ncbi:flagellar hook-basal body complex protein FliE [Pseudooceanicola sediminis]|jgi:flagellar hook-basal body complex protein FliE|uniref:Flagellar hook-basal body complex protein FliE n=2 Tax=Pseudooceanicola TaxID=1679449 RepID=A0A7L9WS18_9RHOB|nr:MULTISPECIES: flagellar hook-basal body complex protein FliE [Pseudooceanicola]KAA2315570.1 flagellar hook-basal body complex protein FliE [Puniceibacterium sp. HSS470]QOL81890.1 flagellar hook-basal body complex protein FliE [Pseudooceanicola spongiae]RII40229.1 flagellar hook-basal body complex protein FliE [Pseudooceanicola sediminis]|tara:strand:- start:16323 stop:16616 length:294 start_codon:yes stop_codon:yes gene_type:complete